MRLDELMRARVFDADGVKLGRVRDVRIVQDGPALGHRGAPLFRVHGLILGGWTKQKQFAMLAVKIPVSATPKQLRDAAEAAADAADEIEQELTPGKDDL